MLKLLISLLLITTIVGAVSIKPNEQVEIYATTMVSNGDIVTADGDIVILYEGYYLTSKRITYNKKSGEIELFEEVKITQGDQYKFLGKYAKFNIGDKTKILKPFYMLVNESNLWISSKRGDAKDKDFDIKSGAVSGCDPTDPMWKIRFSSADYSAKDKWLNLYNNVLFIYDIPIFYMPYFGRSLDKTRRTGLLDPKLGYSNTEGLFYEQPIYIAEQNWWDLELRPQMRNRRGRGVYGTFRFVDSATSNGEITFGSFKERDNYYKKSLLENQEHYGFDFKYENSDFLNQWFNLNLSGQSAIYVETHKMNDVDYINLSSNDPLVNSTSTLILSKSNMFYADLDNYYGAYLKYYQDLQLKSNEETLQKLPTLHYHHYLDTFLDNHLFYNLDIKSTNIRREVDSTATQTDILLPISLQTDIFDEYINLFYRANLSYQHTSFKNEHRGLQEQLESGYYARSSNLFGISTQLGNAYENYTHITELALTYSIDGSNLKSGFYENQEEFCLDVANKNSPECEFYNIKGVDNLLNIEATQYLYNRDGSEKLYYKLTQNIVFDNDEKIISELESELNWHIFGSLVLYNNLFYNYDEKKYSKVFNKISASYKNINMNISHLYKNSFLPVSDGYNPYVSYLTSSIDYTYKSKYSYSATYNYDMELDVKKSAEVGFVYSSRCWDFSIRYLENNRPILARDNSVDNSVFEKFIYFSFALKPLMESYRSGPEFEYLYDDNTK